MEEKGRIEGKGREEKRRGKGRGSANVGPMSIM